MRQLALLLFRNTITLNMKLDEALSRPRARVPPSIVQMLLVLQVQNTHKIPGLCVFFFFFPHLLIEFVVNDVQGVHESQGVTEEYLKLELLIQKVVSPYLGTHGLCAHDCDTTHCSCIMGKRDDLG